LTHADVRVLIAIASYVFQKNEVFPSRESLCAATGIEETNISKRTARLVKLGWLSKAGRQGQRMTYTLLLPDYAVRRMAESNIRKAERRNTPKGATALRNDGSASRLDKPTASGEAPEELDDDEICVWGELF